MSEFREGQIRKEVSQGIVDGVLTSRDESSRIGLVEVAGIAAKPLTDTK